jgi:hypothetical protein
MASARTPVSDETNVNQHTAKTARVLRRLMVWMRFIGVPPQEVIRDLKITLDGRMKE